MVGDVMVGGSSNFTLDSITDGNDTCEIDDYDGSNDHVVKPQ